MRRIGGYAKVYDVLLDAKIPEDKGAMALIAVNDQQPKCLYSINLGIVVKIIQLGNSKLI